MLSGMNGCNTVAITRWVSASTRSTVTHTDVSVRRSAHGAWRSI